MHNSCRRGRREQRTRPVQRTIGEKLRDALTSRNAANQGGEQENCFVSNSPTLNIPTSWTVPFCKAQVQLCDDADIEGIKMWQDHVRALIQYEYRCEQGEKIGHPFAGLQVDIDGRTIKKQVRQLTDIEKARSLGIVD